MLILLHGDEDFLIKQKLQEIIEHYKRKNPEGGNFFRFDAEENQFSAFSDVVLQQSLFSSNGERQNKKKFIIVDRLEKNKDFSERLALHIASSRALYGGEGIVVLVAVSYECVKKTSPLRRVFEESEGKVVSYPKLQKREFAAEVLRMWKKRGLSPTKEAAQYFVYAVADDLWRAEKEIEKIAAFVCARAAEKKGVGAGERIITIGRQDLEIFMRPSTELSAFLLVDALFQKQGKTALRHWNALRKQGESPQRLLGACVWQARNLLLVRSLIDERVPLSRARAIGAMHPFVFQKTYACAKHHSQKDLAKIFEKLFWIDVKAKRGEDPHAGFEKIAIQLS